MKNQFKKISKIFASRLFYLLLGLFFAVAATIYAAGTVSSGQTLTSSLWNGLANEVNTLNSKIDNWPPGQYCILRNGGSCPAGFSDDAIELELGTHGHDMCPGDERAGDSTFNGAGYCSVRIRMCCK